MRKMKLEIETLAVESFTVGEVKGVGTVQGHDSADMNDSLNTCGYNESCAQYATCDDTCRPYTQQKDCGGSQGCPETGANCTYANSQQLMASCGCSVYFQGGGTCGAYDWSEPVWCGGTLPGHYGC